MKIDLKDPVSMFWIMAKTSLQAPKNSVPSKKKKSHQESLPSSALDKITIQIYHVS